MACGICDYGASIAQRFFGVKSEIGAGAFQFGGASQKDIQGLQEAGVTGGCPPIAMKIPFVLF